VGIAYIQEYRFAKYVERLQKQIQEDLDKEFKMFLRHRGIYIESSIFSIEFNKPLNFSTYKDLQLDTERATLYNTVAAIPYLSNQFKLKKYLGLSEEEIKENEELWRAENNYDKYAPQDPKNADLRNLGVRPNDPMAVNPGMDIPQADLPPIAPGEEDLLNTEEGGVNVPPMTNTTDQG